MAREGLCGAGAFEGAVCGGDNDKYDRYLADVFYGAETDDAETVLRTGTFLNRALVVAGLAERFREGNG